jgi:hypothetical protein
LGGIPVEKKDHGLLELPVVALEALETTWKQAHSEKARQHHRQQRFGQRWKSQSVPFACLLSLVSQLEKFIKSRFSCQEYLNDPEENYSKV